MRRLLFLIAFCLVQILVGQEDAPTYVAVSDVGYYEIFEKAKGIEVLIIEAKNNTFLFKPC